MTEAAPRRGASGSRIPRIAIRILILAVSVLLVGWSIRSIGPGKVLAAALEASPGWLALSLAAIVARYLLWAVKWRRMMRRDGAIGFGTTLRAILSGTFANLVTPSANLAGGVVRALVVKRSTGWRLSLAYGWSLADQVTNLLGSVALGGLLAMAVAVGMPSTAGRPAVVLAGVAAVGLAPAFLALRAPLSAALLRPAVARSLARITPARLRRDGPDGSSVAWLEPMARPLLVTGAALRGVGCDIALSGVSRFALCLANALVFRALGVDAPIFETAAVLLLASTVGALTGAVGGIGATELTMIALYAKLGIPTEAAAAATLLHRGTFYALSFMGGSIAMLSGSRKRGDYDEPTLRREPPPAASLPV